MPPRSYLGKNSAGLLGFGLDDGSEAWLPPTPETATAAIRLTSAAGGDPAAVLGPLPPRRGAMGADALATGPMVMPGARVTALDAVERNPNAVPRSLADVGNAPPVPSPQDQALDAASRSLQGGIDRQNTYEANKREEERKARLSAGAGIVTEPPPASASPGTGKPISLARPGGGGGAAGGGAAMGNDAREYSNWLRGDIAQEMSKRPSAGVLIKGGKQQTGEQTQRILGPNADTLEGIRANDAATAKESKLAANADAAFGEAKAGIEAQAAEAEQRAAEARAEIAGRQQQALGQIVDQQRELQSKIARAEIDPQRMWKQSGTGDKVGLGLAMILGGVGQVLMKQNGPNTVLQGMYAAMDRDVDAQVKNIDKQKGDLTELQRVYQQTRAQYEDEGVAADATKIAALQGLKAQLGQEAAKAQAVRGTEDAYTPQQLRQMEQEFRARVGEGPMVEAAWERQLQNLSQQTRSYSVRQRLGELAIDKAILEKQADLETKINGSIAKSYGFTQDRMVGGSAGPSRAKIEAAYKKLADNESDQRKLGVSEREKAGDQPAKKIDSFTTLGPDGKERTHKFADDIPNDVRAKIAERSGAGNTALKNIETIEDKRGWLGWKAKTYNESDVDSAAHGLQLNYDLFQGQGQSNADVIKGSKESAKAALGGGGLDDKKRQVRDQQEEWVRQYGEKK